MENHLNGLLDRLDNSKVEKYQDLLRTRPRRVESTLEVCGGDGRTP